MTFAAATARMDASLISVFGVAATITPAGVGAPVSVAVVMDHRLADVEAGHFQPRMDTVTASIATSSGLAVGDLLAVGDVTYDVLSVHADGSGMSKAELRARA